MRYILFICACFCLTSCAMTGEWIWREVPHELAAAMPDGRLAKRLEKCRPQLYAGQFCTIAYGRKDGYVIGIEDLKQSVELFLLKLPQSMHWKQLPRDNRDDLDARAKRVPYRLLVVSLKPLVVIGMPRTLTHSTSNLLREQALKEDYCSRRVHCINSTYEMKTTLNLEMSGVMPAVDGVFWFSPDAPNSALQPLKLGQVNRVDIGVERATFDTTGPSILFRLSN